ncbi:MAG TPA: alpha/beta fold hydrolase, partial [bacterium]|nr:alpha/beta fold hydrolase [bacterium]
KKEIVAEFLPPSHKTRRDRVIVICDGMPSIPSKQGLARFLSRKGFWVIYPRYRGSWESEGWFLRQSPHLDIIDVIDELPKGLKERTFGREFKLSPKEIFVIGGSFGGAAAALCSLDPRVTKAIANCPVLDWSILRHSEKKETSNRSYTAYLHEAFGNAYRLRPGDWAKLHRGKFYNPAFHVKEIDPDKLMLFHAKDDPYVPWKSVAAFARQTGVQLNLFKRGGHLSTDKIVRKYWGKIHRFFGG